jgi:hypothetical protein
MLKSLVYLYVKIHQTVSVCEDTSNMASVLSPYNFNSFLQSKRCTVCCAADMSAHCLLCHRYVSALPAVPQICQCTVCCATDMSVHRLLSHRCVILEMYLVFA